MAGAGLVSRGLTKVRELMASATHFGKPPEADDLDRIRIQLQECADGRGGEISTRQRAGRLAETYLRLDAAGRHAFLKLIAQKIKHGSFDPRERIIQARHTGHWECESFGIAFFGVFIYQRPTGIR